MFRNIPYFLLALLLITVSCAKENARNDIRVVCKEWSNSGTRTILTNPEVENKISGVTLAAYSNGKLFCSAYFPSAAGPLDLELSDGVQYVLYAIANVPDIREDLPQNEGDIASLSFKLGSLGSVDESGFPMSGSSLCTGGSSGVTFIQLERKFAKVFAHLSCSYPDALIERVRICNLNSVLLPFGESRAKSGSDMMEGCDQSIGTSGDEVFVLYVPENLQGRIGTAKTSRKKNPDIDPAIKAAGTRLTFLETQVRMKSSNEMYSGTVTYRTYAGNNSTDNFDIEGNCVYDWYITFFEDNLQINDWKTDTQSLSDNRFIQVRTPYFALSGENIALSSIVESNIGAENLIPELSDIDGICSSTSLQDVSSGHVTISRDASPGSKANIKVSPRFNAGELSDEGDIVIYAQDLRFSGGPLDLNPGDATSGSMDVVYMHLFGQYKKPERLFGRRGTDWTQSLDNAKITVSCNDASDLLTYTLNPKAEPGVFTARIATLNGRVTDSATVRVADTRYMCTDGKDPVHPAYGSYNRVTSMKKSRIDGNSIWKIGYNWGQVNAGQNKQYWKFGETVFSSWKNHVTCEVEGLAEGYLTQEFDYAFTSTFYVSPEIPKGEYRFIIYWKDAPDIRDSAILKIVGTNVETISVSPSSIKLLKGQSSTFSATVSPSDADCTNVIWESDSDCISLSSEGTVTALRHGSAKVSAKATDGSGTPGQASVEVSELQVRPSSQAVFLGNNITFTAVIIKADGTQTDVSSLCSWTIEDSDIATSMGGGAFTSKSCGTSTVSASYNGTYGRASSTGSLSITQQPTEERYRLKLSPESGTVVREGDLITMEARLYTDIWTAGVLTHTDTIGELISNSDINWTSLDGGNCVRVSAAGKAEALKAGEETIKATLKSDTSVSATCTLYVDCKLDVDNGDWGDNNTGGDNY